MRDIYAVDRVLRERNRLTLRRAESELRSVCCDPARTPERLAQARTEVAHARLRYWGWIGPLPKGILAA